MKIPVVLRLFALAAVCVGPGASVAAPAPQVPGRGDTLSRIVPLPEVVVSTTRPGEKAPFAQSTLNADTLRRLNWGQDSPMALATLPGAYAYSDAGNGVGYSYLSIRGFPQRRISVLVNGVPLNDPESHEVYWIDHPDLLASTSEATLQRGVGSALYGAASLGGSVNLETSPFTEQPAGGVTWGYGSFATRRLMLEAGSGRLADDWNLYARYSRIESAGYRENAWSRLWSYFLALRRQSGPHTVRLNLYGGPEETHLSYLGVTRDYLEGRVTGDASRDRRFNPILYPGENDHFFEPHYELIHSWAPRAGLALTQTLFYFDGRGYYDEQRPGRDLAAYRLSPWQTADSTLAPRDYYRQDADGALVRDAQGRFTIERTDLVRRRTVVNRQFGWVPRVRLEHAGGAVTIGAELRYHDGHHWGEVLSGSVLPPGTPPDHRYYDYHPWTLGGGLFVREEWSPRHALLVTADLGWRRQGYTMEHDVYDGIRFDQTYGFALPRLGATWTPRPDMTVFLSWSQARREPAFRDLYDAEGAGSVPLFAHVDPATNTWSDPLIHPERVNSWEAGGAWRGPAAAATLNLFRMDFRDELVYAGQFNTDLGYPTIGNAARSVHQGVEIAAHATRVLPRDLHLTLEGNATLSDNHFVDYREIYGTAPGDTVRYDGRVLGFFPGQLANLGARLGWRDLSAGIEAQYAGRLYLDNTEDILRSAGARTVLNASAAWRAPLGGANRAELSLRVLNLADRRYCTGGYMDYDSAGNLVPVFIPAATRGWLAQVRVGF